MTARVLSKLAEVSITSDWLAVTGPDQIQMTIGKCHITCPEDKAVALAIATR